jgi:serine/threonine protein kinase/Tol biopolymer transport system component
MDSEDSDKWAELAALIDTLLDTAAARRAALIADLSGGDPVRRRELEELLEECEREPALLTHSAPDLFGGLFEHDGAQFPPALGARYEVIRELGRGGMATVFLARDVKHKRDVAVKVVHPRVTSALAAGHFLHEIEVVAQLQHPHIVPLYDSGEADGSLYYVMPYEAGLSLRERVVRDGQLPIDDVVQILRDVCEALSYAHERGIIHRDIKPDNVLLSGRHAMVADFGVAKAASDAAVPSADAVPRIALGTPAYMPPEQIQSNANIDHRADIYSVGVLSYELLTGRLPFDGKTRDEILSAHLESLPEPLGAHRSDIPVSLGELVMKSIEKNPDDRWQSADEMVANLAMIAVVTSGPVSVAVSPKPKSRRWPLGLAGLAVGLIAAVMWSRRAPADTVWRERWNVARTQRVTDFPGVEADAAISADGQFVAFLADKDSVFDSFVTRVGSEQFANLTGGRLPQLFNEDVRNVGFSPDAKYVWNRVADITSPASVWLIPTSGGALRPFLKTAVTVAWSPDGLRIVYHETTPGDPIFVADSSGRNARRIFISNPGLHNHYVSWSPDGRFIYFSHGLPPDEMDIWRVPSTGGPAERITNHVSRVAYPVLLDPRTLFYTATAEDGTGPWLYSIDVGRRVPHRVSGGVEHYISLSASGEMPDGARRVVAAVSNPSVGLWSVPITDSTVDETAAAPIALPTARAAAPRFAPDGSLWYLGARSAGDELWRLGESGPSVVWKSDRGAVVGAAAVSPDGKSVCFPRREPGRPAALYCSNPDGTGTRAVAESLNVRGAASWSPDGKWIAIAAEEGRGLRLFKIPVGGGKPLRLVDSVASNPVWSPEGKFILYSGTPRGRSAPIKAVTPDGKQVAMPSLVVDRHGDSYRFLPDGKRLVVKQGGFRRQDFWLFDLATGRGRQLTNLKPGESIQRFDVSPNGRRIVFERVRENSDIVLFELPGRADR